MLGSREVLKQTNPPANSITAFAFPAADGCVGWATLCNLTQCVVDILAKCPSVIVLEFLWLTHSTGVLNNFRMNDEAATLKLRGSSSHLGHFPGKNMSVLPGRLWREFHQLT